MLNGAAGSQFAMLNSNDASPATHFYAGDQVGTAQMELSGVGTPVWKGEFTPFGLELDTAETANRYKFTGKERDTESGLDYFGARFYGSAIGRFISPDPMLMMEQKLTDPQQWNMYTYARNNPLAFVDRNGMWPTPVHVTIIQTAFPGLSTHQQSVLIDASSFMDHCMTCQLQRSAYQHSMRAPNQSASDAKKQTDSFISTEQHLAQLFQRGGGSNAGDLNDKSLAMFGNGAHTVADRTSPAHVDGQGNPMPWDIYSTLSTGTYNFPFIDFAAIGLHEALEADPTQAQLAAAVSAVQSYFRQTYGDAAADQAQGKPAANGCTPATCNDAHVSNGFLAR